MAVVILVFVLSIGSVEAVSSVEISKVTLTNNPDRFIDWDVTTDVRAFVKNGVPNYGWLIKDRNEEKVGTYKTEWVSKESGVMVCGTPSAPQLLIETNAGQYPITVPAADASLDENSPNTNHGFDSVLLTISASPKSNWRIVVRFELPAIPAGATINRALLRLCLDKISGDTSTRVYEAHRLAMNWVEAEVTVNQAAAGTPWDFGAFESPVPLAYVNKAVLGLDPNRFIGWDVTTHVRAFLDDGVPNYGWLIKDRNENASGLYKTEWISKEGAPACGSPSAPQLVVETNAGPLPPVTLPAADASLDENSPNLNRGAEPLLLGVSASPKSNWRIVVRFVLPAIPTGETITKATLRLCLDKISGDSSRRVYEAHRLAMNWVEMEVTTNQAAAGTPWDFGAFESPVPLAYVQKDVLGIDPNRFIDWDVTAHVRAFLDDGVPNYGWLIKDRDEEASGLYKTEWISKEGAPACGSPSAPQLVVETSAGSFPFTLPAADASLDENSPNLNRGAEPLLLGISASPKSNWRIVVRFELPADLAGATINRALLRLCLDQISGDQSRRVYAAHRLTMDWVEMEVTANQAEAGIPWDFGAFESPVPLAYVQKDVLGIDPNRFIDWDVTLHVRAFLDDAVPNYGWLIKDRDENASGLYKTEWISKEGAQKDPLKVCGPDSAPQLLIKTTADQYSINEPVEDAYLIDEPVADASLDQNSPNMNRGFEDLLVLRSSGPNSNWRILVRFELPFIPDGEIIDRATLRLCLDKISGDQSRRVYEARRVIVDWVEAEVTANRPRTGAWWNFGAFE